MLSRQKWSAKYFEGGAIDDDGSNRGDGALSEKVDLRVSLIGLDCVRRTGASFDPVASMSICAKGFLFLLAELSDVVNFDSLVRL